MTEMSDRHGLNDDFSRIVSIDTGAMAWQPSPSPTVWRKRLELSGPVEAGRVTSIVRYDRDSSFPQHGHPDGEEILVLEGTFSDEHGDYPAGTFLLNPEGFRHAPRSADGCVLFVKLRQYPGKARKHVVVDTNAAPWLPTPFPGIEHMPLYEEDGHPESIRLVRMVPGVEIGEDNHPSGEELFILDGALRDEHGTYGAGTWVRFPPGSRHSTVSETGVTLYVKRDHLAA